MSGDEFVSSDAEGIDRPMFRLFSDYGQDNAALLRVGILLSVISRVASLLPVLILGITVDAVLLNTAPYQLPLIPEGVIPKTSMGQYLFSALLILAVSIMTAVTSYGQGLCLQAFAQRVQHSVRTDTYDAMQALDMSFFVEYGTGEMTSILSNDVNQCRQFLTEGINVGGRLVFTLIGVILLMVLLNWQLALVALLPAPIVAVFTYYFVNKVKPIYGAVRSTVGRLNSRIETNVSGIRVIKTNNAACEESSRIEEISDTYLEQNWDAIRYRVLFRPSLQTIGSIGFLATFVVGGYWVLAGPPAPFSGELTAGTFVIFVFYSQRLVWPMGQFGSVVNLYHETQASVARIFALQGKRSRLEEHSDPDPLQIAEGAIKYNDVSFTYKDFSTGSTDFEQLDSTDYVLSDISLDFPGGAFIAYVGPTGAGKSTLAKLVLRLYDVDQGSIEIDGQNIKRVSIDDLRNAIGYVGQDSLLFPGTVQENISYAAPETALTEVEQAAKTAQAHDFITELENGYETEVGERGVKLSGGQRQRIAIARALLTRPEILILDEATSDMDTETERAIQHELEQFGADITVISIAHRLSTIRGADQIVFLENGMVIEQGTHQELLDQNGRYADLWRSQVGEPLEGSSSKDSTKRYLYDDLS